MMKDTSWDDVSFSFSIFPRVSTLLFFSFSHLSPVASSLRGPRSIFHRCQRSRLEELLRMSLFNVCLSGFGQMVPARFMHFWKCAAIASLRETKNVILCCDKVALWDTNQKASEASKDRNKKRVTLGAVNSKGQNAKCLCVPLTWESEGGRTFWST